MATFTVVASSQPSAFGIVTVFEKNNFANTVSVSSLYNTMTTSFTGQSSAELADLLATAKALATVEVKGNTKDFMRWLNTP